MIPLLICALGLAQEIPWSATHGGAGADGARAVALLEGGDLAVAGQTWSSGAGGSDGLLLCLDAAGQVLWSQTLGGPGWDRLADVAALPDGGLVAVGSTTAGAAEEDLWLVRTDSAGAPVWSRTLGGPDVDQGEAVLVLEDGLVVAGSTASEGEGQLDAWLVRTDLEGEVLWTLTWGEDQADRARAVALAPDGDLVVAGSWGSSNRELMLARVSPQGSLRWVSQVGGGRDDVEWGEDVVVLDDGRIAAVGHGDVLNRELLDVLVVLADGDTGEPVWTSLVGESSFYDYGYALVPVTGGLLVAGSTLGPDTGTGRGYLVHVDLDGETTWTWATGEEAHFLDLVRVGEARVVAVGQTASEGAGRSDAWVVAVDLP